MDWRLLPKTGKLSFEFTEALRRSGGACVAIVEGLSQKLCGKPAVEAVEVTHPAGGRWTYALCADCRKAIYGKAPAEKAKEKASLQKKQGSLF